MDTSLTRSVATQSLADVLGTVSETAIDAALDSGVLRDIPIIGTITGVLKAGSDIKSALFLRKVTIFLKTLSEISDEDRKKFIDEMKTPEQKHKFGEAILLLLERAEDMAKPKLIAKIINAHIMGHIEQTTAFRICAMIDRCYVQDLELLRNFTNGTQGRNTPVAETLLSVGFLSNGGFDGGSFSDEDSGGVVYNMNEYGKMFVEHALKNG
ncbi:MAG: hypothetical protein GY941_17555 [Planctomycetes bacterium]|nr:hypothetical protein [Planctomycetota bacterium]